MPDVLQPDTPDTPDPADSADARDQGVPPAAPVPPRRPRRWRRWIVRAAFALAALLTVLVALGYYYSRPKQLTPIVEGLIGRAVGGVARLDRADLTFDGHLTLDGLTVGLPGPRHRAPGYARLFDCERIAVRLDIRRVWRGVVDAREVDIRRPRLHLVEDPRTGRLNIEDLPLPRGGGPGVEVRLPPRISLSGARARFATLDASQVDRTDAVLRLAGELREQPDHPRRYDLVLQTYGDDAVADTQLTGWVDTANPGLNLDLAGLAFNASYRPFVPPAFRALWDRLEPVGRVPAAAVNLETDSRGRIRLNRAALELADVALTPPYAELGLFDDDMAPDAAGPRYAPRMTRVNGRLIADERSVRIENLTGAIEGVNYHLNGSWGLDPATPGALTLQTDAFTVERNPLFVSGLPAAAAGVFARLKPSGRFRATTHVRRATPGGEVAVSGRVEVLDARALYAKFPFPIEGLRGAVTFDPDVVRLEGLTGRGPAGGVITLDGEIAPPRKHAGVRLLVTARGVPYDDHVRAALGRNGKAADLFFDGSKLDALRLWPGVGATLDAPAPTQAGAAADPADGTPVPPRFALGGELNADVLIDRPPGPGGRYAVRTTLHPAGLGLVFTHFPYPVTATGGRVVIAPGGIDLRGLTLVGPTGATATVAGRIDQPEKHGPTFPDLEISDIRAPADVLLLAALPDDAQQHLRPLHLEGEARGAATVLRPPVGGDTRFVVRGGLTGARARPGSGALIVSPLDAAFVVTRDHAEITSLHGDLNAGGALDLKARFDWAPGRQGFTLRGAALGVTFTPALVELIPEGSEARTRVSALIKRWQPGGVGDLRLRARRKAADADTDTDTGATSVPAAPPAVAYALEIEPRTLSLMHGATPLSFEQVSGRATVRPDRVELDKLTGVFPTGRAAVNGEVGLGPDAQTVLDLTAATTLPCPVARAVLPPAVTGVIDAMELRGGVTVSDARLLLRPDSPARRADENAAEFDGRLGLHDTRLTLGVPVTELSGGLLARVRTGAGRIHPELSFDLNAETARVSDRLVSPLTVKIDNTRWPDTLTFGPLLGSVYGGVLVGEGSIPLTDDQPCRLRLSLTDVDVAGFIGAPTSDPGGDTPSRAFTDAARDAGSGLLSAGLTLELPLGRPADRRGRGVLRVRDASLVNRPFSNAVLRATNLSLPSGSPLDRASARYLLSGDTVRFDELSISGPGLSITGAGTMTLPDNQLRLLMVSRSTAGPPMGPLADLVEMFRDELIAIKVRGTLSDPVTEVTALRGIRKSLRTLFGDE